MPPETQPPTGPTLMDVRFQPFWVSPVVLTSILASSTIQLFTQANALFSASSLPVYTNKFGAGTAVVSLEFSIPQGIC